MRQWLGLVVVGLLLGCGAKKPVQSSGDAAGLVELAQAAYAEGDFAKAAELYGKACDGGDEPACDALKDL